MALVVVLLSSMKSVLEEGILHAKEMPPLLLVGLQGMLCCTVMTVALVGAHCLGVENLWGTLAMLRSGPRLNLHVLAFGFTMVSIHIHGGVL